MREQYQVWVNVDGHVGYMSLAGLFYGKECFQSYEEAMDAKRRFFEANSHHKIEYKIRKRSVTDWEEVSNEIIYKYNKTTAE